MQSFNSQKEAILYKAQLTQKREREVLSFTIHELTSQTLHTAGP